MLNWQPKWGQAFVTIIGAILVTIDGVVSVSKLATKTFGTQKGNQKGNYPKKGEGVAKIYRGKFYRNKKAVIVVAIIYSLLLCFMIKMIGIGATASFFLFLGICSLPALLARALGDKSQVANDDDSGGYRYIYSYRYGSRIGNQKR